MDEKQARALRVGDRVKVVTDGKALAGTICEKTHGAAAESELIRIKYDDGTDDVFWTFDDDLRNRVHILYDGGNE
jgi:hypothetical protein